MEIFLLLFFILVLAIFLGLELISKIPSTLHTPLMSGANAISGITLVGFAASKNPAIVGDLSRIIDKPSSSR